MQSTASCSTNATPPSVLYSVLQELETFSCRDEYGMVASVCLVAEYECFVDVNCRQCLAAVHAAANDDNVSNHTKAAALHSPACTATSSDLLSDIARSCSQSFPGCTFYKQQCFSSPECGACLATLASGNGA